MCSSSQGGISKNDACSFQATIFNCWVRTLTFFFPFGISSQQSQIRTALAAWVPEECSDLGPLWTCSGHVTGIQISYLSYWDTGVVCCWSKLWQALCGNHYSVWHKILETEFSWLRQILWSICGGKRVPDRRKGICTLKLVYQILFFFSFQKWF